jgi:putative transposase
MFTIRQLMKRSKEEKERIIKEIQKMGIVAGCRHFGLSKSLFYDWVRRYNSLGIEGLEDRRRVDLDKQYKKLEKENERLKQLLAEKELESRMKDDLLKKKMAQWNRGKR